MTNKKIYIAGKISGEQRWSVFSKFMAAESQVKLKYPGCEVVNPIRFCGSEWPWLDCMRVCITHLMGCDAIYMLKDWKQSRGARLEHFIALKLGMRIIKEGGGR